MLLSLAFTALLMGLMGGPHCAAMCGAACGGIARASQGRAAMWTFLAGRLLGYSLAGAVAAFTVGGVAALTGGTSPLRPVWMLFHLAVLAWGLMLLAQARQPAWAEAAGRAVWSRVQPRVIGRTRVFTAGALWAFMPCGLLWSALLVASLAGGPFQGALCMALFAAGSAVSLALAPALLRRLARNGNRLGQDWGTRAAGLLLAAAAAWALWMDMAERVALWCNAG